MQGTILQTQDMLNKTDIFPALKSLPPLLRFIGHWCGQINNDFFQLKRHFLFMVHETQLALKTK